MERSSNNGNSTASNSSDCRDEVAQLQQRVAFLQNELKQMQSMAALGELTGTATHEFNNVLMTVINFAKLGIRNRDDASRDKALSKILAASERAAKITNTILAQAKNRGESFEPTDLAELINSSLILLEREMRKYRVSIDVQVDESVPKVYASGNQIGRVLLNLLINARQAMPEGGSILIKLAEANDPQASDQSGCVELTVRDTGSGMDRQTLQRIFEPYFSTKDGPDESGRGGTGLGLAACKEIIDGHQGRIRVESTVGQGTAFIIRLPVQQANQAAA